MEACNNCVHDKICALWRSQEVQDASSFQLSGCDHFQDQSMYLALPCPIGSTVYVIGHKYRAGRDECWINTGKLRPSDLEKIGERVFLTYEDAKSKIFAMNKGNSRLLFVERSSDGT